MQLNQTVSLALLYQHLFHLQHLSQNLSFHSEPIVKEQWLVNIVNGLPKNLSFHRSCVSSLHSSRPDDSSEMVGQQLPVHVELYISTMWAGRLERTPCHPSSETLLISTLVSHTVVAIFSSVARYKRTFNEWRVEIESLLDQ